MRDLSHFIRSHYDNTSLLRCVMPCFCWLKHFCFQHAQACGWGELLTGAKDNGAIVLVGPFAHLLFPSWLNDGFVLLRVLTLLRKMKRSALFQNEQRKKKSLRALWRVLESSGGQDATCRRERHQLTAQNILRGSALKEGSCALWVICLRMRHMFLPSDWESRYMNDLFNYHENKTKKN